MKSRLLAIALVTLAAFPAFADDFTPYTMDQPKIQKVIAKAQHEAETVLRYKGEIWIPLDSLNNTLAVLDTFEADAVKAKNDTVAAAPPPPKDPAP